MAKESKIDRITNIASVNLYIITIQTPMTNLTIAF